MTSPLIQIRRMPRLSSSSFLGYKVSHARRFRFSPHLSAWRSFASTLHNVLRFGIEVEFLLTPRDGKDYGDDPTFVKRVHDTYKEDTWPGMHIDIEGSYAGTNDTSLTNDESVKVIHYKQYKYISYLSSRLI